MISVEKILDIVLVLKHDGYNHDDIIIKTLESIYNHYYHHSAIQELLKYVIALCLKGRNFRFIMGMMIHYLPYRITTTQWKAMYKKYSDKELNLAEQFAWIISPPWNCKYHNDIQIVNGINIITVKYNNQLRLYNYLNDIFDIFNIFGQPIDQIWHNQKSQEIIYYHQRALEGLMHWTPVINMSDDMFESAKRFLCKEAIFYNLYKVIVNGIRFNTSKKIFFIFLNDMGWSITDTYTIMQKILDESCLAELAEFKLVKQNIQEAMEYSIHAYNIIKGEKYDDCLNEMGFDLCLIYSLYKIVIKFGKEVYKPFISNSSIGVHKIVIIDDNPKEIFKMDIVTCDLYNEDFDSGPVHLWISIDEVHKNVTIQDISIGVRSIQDPIHSFTMPVLVCGWYNFDHHHKMNLWIVKKPNETNQFLEMKDINYLT